MKKFYILVILGFGWIFLAGGNIRSGDYYFAAIFMAVSIFCLAMAWRLKKKEDRRLAQEKQLLEKYRRRKAREQRREIQRQKQAEAGSSKKSKYKKKKR